MGLSPDVTLLNVNNNTTNQTKDIIGYMEALYDHFVNTSTRWTVKQGNKDAFTLVPDAASEDFEVNLRRQNAEESVYGLIVPSGSVDSEGDPTTQPTVTNDVGYEDSGEYLIWEVDYSSSSFDYSPEFYVVELDDVVFGLNIDSPETITPSAFRFGRTFTPFFNNIESGLSLGGQRNVFNLDPNSVGASIDTTQTFHVSLNMVYPTGWFVGGTNTDQDADIFWKGRNAEFEIPGPMMVLVDSGSDNNQLTLGDGKAIGYTRYRLNAPVDAEPGTILEAGTSKFVYISLRWNDSESNFKRYVVIPWDNTTPKFA